MDVFQTINKFIEPGKGRAGVCPGAFLDKQYHGAISVGQCVIITHNHWITLD